MFDIIIEDLYVYAYRLGLSKWFSPLMIFIYPATWPIVVYRFGNWANRFNVFIIKQIFFLFYFILKRLTEILTGIEIAHNAQIGKGLFIGHLGGVIIGNNSKIGEYSSFHEGVTIGGAGRGKNHGSPVIGNLVYFGAGAKVIGRIKIGNNVMIGANAVVLKNTPDNAVVGGIPAKILNYKGSVDYIHFKNKEDFLNEK